MVWRSDHRFVDCCVCSAAPARDAFEGVAESSWYCAGGIIGDTNHCGLHPVGLLYRYASRTDGASIQGHVEWGEN